MNEHSTWLVKKELVRTDYPVIENLKQFLIEEVPYIHPDHPAYVNFWSRETKKCIEGVWGKEFGKWRYMPGNLYYFGNYTILEDTQALDGVPITKHFKPKVVDYYWEFSYSSWTCYGFSGFEKDEEISCNRKLELYYNGDLTFENLPKSCIKPDGTPKLYENAYKYLHRLHDKNLGRSLFENEAKDNIILGTRGGGKSFWAALGELEYNFVFGGARRYDKDFINNELSSRQLVGSADKTKSSELLDKFKKSQDAKIENKNDRYVKWFGTYTEIYYDERGRQKEKVTPCPFYKKSTGNLECPNKENPYKAEYRVEINGEWKKKGTGSELVHVNYSTKKGDGAQAGVGGRYLFSNVEEIGLVQNYTDIWTSNKSATRRNGLKFGVQWAQGTSGNIEFVQEAKKVFLNPQDYDCLTFTNVFSASGQDGKIGYFIPSYIVQFDCKDENGNTDYDKAIAKVNKGRREASKSKDPKVLRDHLMNEPCYVDEMWLTNQGYYLPYEEAAIREKQLMQFDNYRMLEKCVKLAWDSTKPRGVDYKLLHDGEPYREFPIVSGKRKNPQGCIVIYEFPVEINGYVPPDMYRFVGLDPYVEQDITKGGSIGSLYIIMNPKYIPYGYNGNTIVASYNDKPLAGLDEYYENVEKLLAFYGNPLQGLNFEKNRGESCRAHFIKKNKTYLLMPTPQREMGASIYQRNISSFGYIVGNKIAKITLTTMLRDWLLEETTLADGTKKNIERIPCLYLIRQIMQYDIDENFDAVDGLRGAVIALREYENKMQAEAKTKEKSTTDFKGYLNNGRIFNKKQHGPKRFSKA